MDEPDGRRTGLTKTTEASPAHLGVEISNHASCAGSAVARGARSKPTDSFDVTIESIDGGYSSAAERLTVAQDVVGSIPTSRPNSSF